VSKSEKPTARGFAERCCSILYQQSKVRGILRVWGLPPLCIIGPEERLHHSVELVTPFMAALRTERSTRLSACATNCGSRQEHWVTEKSAAPNTCKRGQTALDLDPACDPIREAY